MRSLTQAEINVLRPVVRLRLFYGTLEEALKDDRSVWRKLGNKYSDTVIRHLEAGRHGGYAMGVLTDWADGKVLGLGHQMTDGKWTWDQAIVKLVKTHGIELDPDFVIEVESA